MKAAPNARSSTRATYSIATTHSDTTACAASSAQVLGVSASASCGAQTHKGQLKWLRKLRS